MYYKTITNININHQSINQVIEEQNPTKNWSTVLHWQKYGNWIVGKKNQDPEEPASVTLIQKGSDILVITEEEYLLDEIQKICSIVH
jgi:hypothetical protein